jgi:hypothetical protein
MKSLEAVDRQNLIWKQTGLGARDFELWSRDDLVARLYWPKLLSQRAVAECSVGTWHIERVGFFRQRTVVTPAHSDLEIASFEAGWLGDGDLALADGRMLHWYRTKALGNAWALADPSDNVLIEIQAGTHWFKYHADVILWDRGESWAELSLLILVAWYLAYIQIQDSAAAVAVTCTAACT